MSIILTILASILVFGGIIFVHELGHFLAAKACKIKVNEFAIGMGPRLIHFKKGDTEYSLRLFPIGGFTAMEGEDEESDEQGSFLKAPVRARIFVTVAGAIMNLVLGFAVLFGVTASQGVIATRTIAKFEEGASTHASGLEVGDTILAINGRRMYVADDMFYELVRIKDGTADILVLRDGQEVMINDVEFSTTLDADGVPQLELDFFIYGNYEPTFGDILKESWMQTLALTRQIFLSLMDLITGNVAINQLAGPVGIVTYVSEAVGVAFSAVLMIMALISINLGVMNLLPLPALDGGRLVFLMFEGITKRRLKPKYEAIIHVAGFALLILLMVFVTYNDITRIFTR